MNQRLARQFIVMSGPKDLPDFRKPPVAETAVAPI